MEKKRLVARLGVTLAALLVLVVLLAAVVYVKSNAVLDARHEVDAPAIADASASPALLARGAHVARTRNCFECHGDGLAGKVFADAPPFRVVASNLTPAGAGQRYRSAADWDRAVRHGLFPDGRSMWTMPSYQFAALSDADAAALYAYLASLAPVERELPEQEMRALGRALVVAGEVKLMRDLMQKTMRVPAAEPGVTADYGAYLFASTCAACHRADLQGGPHPDPVGLAVPPLGAAAQWSPEDFRATLRTGTTPTGRALHAKWMPWEDYRHLTDDEMYALHLFLQRELGGAAGTRASGPERPGEDV